MNFIFCLRVLAFGSRRCNEKPYTERSRKAFSTKRTVRALCPRKLRRQLRLSQRRCVMKIKDSCAYHNGAKECRTLGGGIKTFSTPRTWFTDRFVLYKHMSLGQKELQSRQLPSQNNFAISRVNCAR